MTLVVRTRSGPRAYAYLRKSLLTIDSEVIRTKGRLTAHAKDLDVELAAVFVEEFGATAAAFERLVQAAIRDKVSVILLPSLLHFAVLGSPKNIKRYFEDLTRTRVVTLPECRSAAHTSSEVVSCVDV